MVKFTFATSCALLATLTTAAVIPRQSPNAKAVYVLTNDVQNAVLAYKVNGDGTLSAGTTTSTKGRGRAGYPSPPNSHVAYQGAVGVIGNTVVALNTGSNTFAILSIDEQDPTKLTLVGDTHNSNGEIPVSVAVSEKLQQFCIGHTGSNAAISCFSIDAQRKVTSVDQTRRVLVLKTASPPPNADRTLSEVLFNADSTALIVTLKGAADGRNSDDPRWANYHGLTVVFPVSQEGVVSSIQDSVASSPEGTAFLSGATAIPGTNRLLVTDSSQSIGGAVIVQIDAASHKVSIVKAVPIEGNKATSHAAFSANTGSVFISDEQVNHLVEINAQSGAILHNYSIDGHRGFSDLQAAGGFVYALDPAEQTRISVVDVATGREVQNFVAQGLGVNAQGLAVRV